MAVMVGCGGGNDDKLMKDQIAVLEQIAATWDKVTDKASFAAADAEVRILNEKAGKLAKELNDLGKERADAAMATNKTEFDLAMTRLSAAKEKARKKASG
ncbi:MAG TPA: hypothetical protein VEL76_33140 [Gemmataceae bacterium]|nr:hypothetical protein [Gemmataceae bacterium]